MACPTKVRGLVAQGTRPNEGYEFTVKGTLTQCNPTSDMAARPPCKTTLARLQEMFPAAARHGHADHHNVVERNKTRKNTTSHLAHRVSSIAKDIVHLSIYFALMYDCTSGSLIFRIGKHIGFLYFPIVFRRVQTLNACSKPVSPNKHGLRTATTLSISKQIQILKKCIEGTEWSACVSLVHCVGAFKG